MIVNELRRGNWIDYFGTQLQVTGISDAYIVCEEPTYEVFDPGNVKPIPLTSEWLERFGFERVNDYRYQNYDYMIEVMMNGDKVVRIRQSDHESWPISTIKFVHQAQNLYFALTGKELTLKDL